MTVKTKRISTLIESQLPEFISTEYELFGKFLQKYYESQEVQGGPLDVINNIQKYADIDYYEKNLLKQKDTLAVTVSSADTTITLLDATSFPEKDGYVRIDNEIIFYRNRTDTQLLECVRGVSGNTTLGDLYETTNFVSTEAAVHNANRDVYNVSNLFLYAFVKNFENQYLGSFPEKYLKGEVDKRTLIKNISKFYKSKGTSSSIKFVFNTIIAKDTENKPDVYKPRDFTYKSSEADWVNVYALKVKVISGDPTNLIGLPVVQNDEEAGYASATVDNVYADGTIDGEKIWNIVLAPETVNGSFGVSTKTRLEQNLSAGASAGDKINVFSTVGWETYGKILINEETIEFDDKNVVQFNILKRGVAANHTAGDSVYKPITIKGGNVELLTLGVVYNLDATDAQAFASSGDTIEVSNPGFETSDPKIVQTGTNQPRWIIGDLEPVSSTTVPTIAAGLSDVPTNVSSIYGDDEYYYITSSSFPSYNIFDGSNPEQTLQDQKHLRIIRKQSTDTTEIYKTSNRDVGILLNGVPVFGYKDRDSLKYGILQEIKVSARGRNYARPPFVLINGVPNQARAYLNGQVIDRIEVNTGAIFTDVPRVEILSGRNAKVSAVVTGGKLTSLVIDDPGEFYSSPPIVRIRDLSGKGRFADYNAIINTAGAITGFEKISEGNFYTPGSVVVDILAVGEDATATPVLKEWVKNRFVSLTGELDTEFGYVFENYDYVQNFGYGQVANPKSLRVQLGDNLNLAGTEPASKTHSPILGFAYDGNPIYGPFGHENPLDASTPIVRMTSSYSIKGSRTAGPDVLQYPIGSFIDDYQYNHRSGSLDENNGRFCITPDFPKGTYAYFITIDSNQVPQFPYVVGDNFYSLPVDSNYNSPINQNDIPKNAKRLYTPGMPGNGGGLIAKIADVNSGGVEGVFVERSSNNFSVNSQVFFDNLNTEGEDAEAIVSSVKGKQVNYLESKENKVVKLTTIQNAYLFQDDVLTQPSSTARGTIVGTVQNDNTIVLKDVVGTFDNTGTFSAATKTFIFVLDQDSSYTKGAILSLTDGVNPPIATGEVLEGTSRQNTVQIKVLSGTWILDDDYFLQSDNLFNTSGTKITVITSLSDNLEPFEVNQSVALVETATPHGLGVGDTVNVDINPDDSTKTQTYYVRKRLYQDVVFQSFSNETTINYSGVGRFTIMNGGADYTEGVYTDVPLKGGSGTGATAVITVSAAGIVNDIQLETGGKNYKRGDFLKVDDDELARSGASLSTSRLSVYVDHAGVGSQSSEMRVDSVDGYASGDLLQVGSEIVEISSITGDVLNILRGRAGTEAVNHYDGASIELYKPRYNFAENFAITENAGTGYIKSYDLETQTATVIFEYGIDKVSAESLTISTTFFDSSTPGRLVKVSSVGVPTFRFEISPDNVNFTDNPDLDIQEFYRYVFDTSHSSMTGVQFSVSPSSNFNLLTLEQIVSTITPGITGSFVDLKFGFGSRLADNDYSVKTGTNFSSFYYFDKNGNVASGNAQLNIIQDPLQGEKRVNYVTPTRFVYDVPSTPLWDGSGQISYTTNGQFAIGEINNINIINFGQNYKKLPIITGVDPSLDYRGAATVRFDSQTNTIVGVDITNKGSNYVNPIAIITDGDGTEARFKTISRNGQLFSITVENPGKNYTYTPTIRIIEGDTDLFAESSEIGVPRSVNIIRNGGAFHLDKTVSSTITSKYAVALRGITGDFQKGEVVEQRINGAVVFRGYVSEWRIGSNILRVEDISGIIRENVSITGRASLSTATVKSVFVSTFSEKITSFYDNLGYYTSDKGKLGVANQKLTDSDFYQDYSYVIKSKTSIEQWRDLIKSTTHPAGFKLFGQVDIEGSATTSMPSGLGNKASHFTSIQLWNPEKNKITSDIKQRVVTQSIQKVQNTRIRKGQGSAATSEFNFNETRAFDFTLNAAFDGYYDTDGRLQGTRTFALSDDLGNPFFPVSAENLIITLDGVLQEPEVAYTVNSNQITFAQPPLGDNVKLTGQNSGAVTAYKGVKFYGRNFNFNKSQFNPRYIRKIRNIFQRNGRWIDAANQIERNKTFIIQEALGYGRDKYAVIDWSTKLDDYTADVGYLLDSYIHDLRFGGNAKVVDYATIFSNTDYIKKNSAESLDIYHYATRLARLAIRNWDITDESVSYLQGDNRITVTSTKDLAIGMHVSSGRAFPLGTKIVSIDSLTQITVDNFADANSGGAGGASIQQTNISGTTNGQSVVFPTSVAAVLPGDEFQVGLGDTASVPISFSGIESATFYLSAITTGTFYDASNLIEGNLELIAERALEDAMALMPNQYYEYIMYPENHWYNLKDYIESVVYHLRYGGNERIVSFWERVNLSYPPQESLTVGLPAPDAVVLGKPFLRFHEEFHAMALYESTKHMVSAMRNTLQASPNDFSGANRQPFIDNSVAADTQFPYCVEVESALYTMQQIVQGSVYYEDNTSYTGPVDPTPQNQNKRGNWTEVLTYSNYNIIADPLIPSQECNDVISSVDTLYDTVDDIFNDINVELAVPDFIDGENKEFELYWSNGDPVITEKDENLLITINAVLQATKFNASYPGEDAYYIDRTVSPNRLVFDVAPIWDQDAGAKTLGEPTAVEKVAGVGIGNYKRLTIDKNLVNNVRSGPFLILDLEDRTVQSVDEPDYLLVFVDGVLQVQGESYNVSGPNIFFEFPVTEQMKVDMRYLYGRDVGQILNIYDYNADQYFAQANIDIYTTSGINEFIAGQWSGIYRGGVMQLVQFRADGTTNALGEITDYSINGNVFSAKIFGAQAVIEDLDVYVCIKGRYNINQKFEIDQSQSSLTYERDENGRITLRGTDQIWRGTYLRNTYRNPFISLSNSTQIRVEGQDTFRRIQKLPSTLTSKEQRIQEDVSNSYFGFVEIASYNGISRGEGLSIVAEIENGSVVNLVWNQRSYDPITQPTAYQYYTPPVINFVPKDGNGGGASAKVIVSKGQVISVELVNGGSGYTEAPQVVVARRYEVIEETDIGVSLINVGINKEAILTMSGFSTIAILGNQVSGVNTFTSILFNSPIDSDRVITAEMQLVEECSEDLSAGLVRPLLKMDDFLFDDSNLSTIEHEATQINISIATPYIVNIESESTLTATATREITSSVANVINNTALSNINYYEVASFLDVQLDPGDTVVYVADTSKFKTNGYLLIGKEIVRYMRKLGDRFMMVQRAQDGTTEGTWAAGTYLRQIPDPVSIAYGGISVVESESQIVTLKGGPEIGGSESYKQQQVIAPVNTVQKVHKVIQAELQIGIAVESSFSITTQVRYKLEQPLSAVTPTSLSYQETTVAAQVQILPTEINVYKGALEILLIPPPGGVVDGYQESIFITDPVETRINGFVDLLNDYGVTTRSGQTVFITNSVSGVSSEYIGQYTTTNVGPTLGNWYSAFSDGSAKVSAPTIEMMSAYFASLTVGDFEERKNSSYSKSGIKFNLGNPSIQNPITQCTSGVSSGTISVNDTSYFEDSGYLIYDRLGQLNVVQYTSKTSNTFIGITQLRGTNLPVSGTEVQPFTIS